MAGIHAAEGFRPTGLSYFGFFKELGFRVGNTVSGIDIERGPCPERAAAAAYLRAGSPLVVVPGCLKDPMSESSRTVLGGGSVLTDGEWVWPEIAADFVHLHGASLPDAFLQHMRSSRFTVRTLLIEEILAVFAVARDALAVEPVPETLHIATTPRLVILDIRMISEQVVSCIARAEGGPICEEHELTDRIKVGKIVRHTEQLPMLASGETARVTLHGACVAQIGIGAVLTTMNKGFPAI